MKKLKILLIGQPNVGKSSLLSAVVGPKVVISNYPGTTVEITEAKKKINDTEIEFIDTPGIYSASNRSEEEKVTERALFERGADGTIMVVDATALERSLYMVLQILEAKLPFIIALNFMEEAEKKGININIKKLEEFLNVPIIPINPITKKGIDNLMDSLLKLKTQEKSFKVRYDDHIEAAIEQISAELKESKLPKRFVALRILEGDRDFYKYLKDKEIIQKVKNDLLKEHPKVAEDIAITRYGTASFIAKEVTQITRIKKEKTISEKIDGILLHKILGPFSTILFFLIVFGILLFFGNWIQNILMDLTERFLSPFDATNSVIALVLNQGITGLVAGISIALPYVFLFYLILGLLEDAGLLPRFIINAQWLLGKLGLPGKSLIPLALGLGCTVPAVRATRLLSSRKERLYTVSLFAFVPCSSRTAIIMGVVGFYGGLKLAIAVFVTLVFAGLIWTFIIKKAFRIKSEPLLLELPDYRRPLLGNILAKSWLRMKDFVYIVIPLLVIGGMIYGILDILKITDAVVGPFTSVTSWLGLPGVTIIPLLFGFLQKDLTGAMLISVLGVNITTVLTPIQIYTFGVAAAVGIPCINALGMLIKEFGFGKTIVLAMILALYGLLFAGLTWRVISIF